jgi:hypothetical protein
MASDEPPTTATAGRARRKREPLVAGAALAFGEKTDFDAASPEQRQSTEDWFVDYLAGLDAVIAGVRAALKRAFPDDKESLRALKANLEGEHARAAQQQEAFFTDNTLMLAPPSAAVIARTKDLAGEMDQLIRSQRRAEAIAALLNDLADLVKRIGV